MDPLHAHDEPLNGAPAYDLVLNDLSKRFHGDEVVRPTSLSVYKGELFFFLGPSGSGKSTTLRMVAGLEKPSGGSVHLRGRDVTDLPPHRRDTAMVFQDWALFPHKTVGQNVAFGLRMRKVPRQEIKDLVSQALERVRLPGFEDRSPRTLSGGQKQRVALARALVISPSVLLLDEPLSSLDQNLRQEMRAEIVRIQRELDITTVFVTHDQIEALTMADRLAVMHDGQVVQIGSPMDLYQRPADAFVAGFLGAATSFSGRVMSVDADSVEIESAGQSWRAANSGRAVAPGDQVRVFCRPERIDIRSSGDAPVDDSSNVTAGEIVGTFYQGATIRLEADCPIGRVIVDVPSVGESVPRLSAGSAVELRLPPDALIVTPGS
jgi:ABC-type Fe3+/spermidine/putrescine transport system ATPase subunit